MGRALTGLDAVKLRRGSQELADGDDRLHRLLAAHGPPPLWERPAGFATLVKIILEQQVSLDSAAAAYANLESVLGVVSPRGFLEVTDAELKRIGFSRQKAGYCRGLAAGLVDGTIDLEHLDQLGDSAVVSYLTSIRGIGPWTADVYTLFALRRPDVWPRGDRALVVSMMENLDLDDVPSYESAALLAERWKPWRSVAARMLWHSYLLVRSRSLE